MEDEAPPISARVLLVACALAIGVFATSATVAWRQFRSLGGEASMAEPGPAAVSPRAKPASGPFAGQGAPAAVEPPIASSLAPWPSGPRAVEPGSSIQEWPAGGNVAEAPDRSFLAWPWSAAMPGIEPAEAALHGAEPAFLPETTLLQEADSLPGPAPEPPLPPNPEMALEAEAPPVDAVAATVPSLPSEGHANIDPAEPAADLRPDPFFFLPVASAVAVESPGPALALPAAAPEPVPPVAQPRARICAGSPTGNYTFAAREIAAHAGALGGLEVITTAGSGDNLRRLAGGECEMGFSQADVLALRAIEHPQQVAGLDPFKRVYGEYVHVLCPLASGWANAGSFDGRTRLIVGGEGSGTAETWRAFTRAAPALAAVQRVNDPINLVAVNRVKDSRDTCMLWISGLNSADMQGANRMSANTPDGRRAMRLVSVTNLELRGLRLADGQPIYRFEQITARSGSYENLLDSRVAVNAEGRRFVQGGSVTVPVVDAVLVVRQDYLARLPGRGAEIVAAVEDAGPAIWARVSPRR